MMRVARENIAILVVTYNPRDTGMKAFVQLAEREDTDLIIVDNASRNPLSVEGPRVTVVRLRRNVGLAAALNLGVLLAARRGYRFVAVFDQDSIPCTDILQVFRKKYESFWRQNLGGRFILSASYTQPVDERPQRAVNVDRPCPQLGSNDWYEVELTTTSGMFFPIDIYSEIGGFDSDFYLDLVDYDFIARLLSHGIKVFRSTKPMMIHRVGTLIKKSILGKSILVMYHTDTKRYLLVGRNLIVFIRRHFSKNPRLIVRVVLRVTFRVIKVGVFCDRKAVWSFLKGLYMGAVKPNLPAYFLLRSES